MKYPQSDIRLVAQHDWESGDWFIQVVSKSGSVGRIPGDREVFRSYTECVKRIKEIENEMGEYATIRDGVT